MYSQSPYFLLDSYSAEDLSRWEAQKEKILRYHWDLFSALAYERHKMADHLRSALLEAAISSYEFKGWQRQVRYKYSLTPLSSKGSLFEPGGRFNIPEMNSNLISAFPALYIAEDKETALQEAGQQKNASSSLTSLDLALIRKDSITIVAVSGKLDTIIDLRHLSKLKPFLKLIKAFKVPQAIARAARKIGVPPYQPMKTFTELYNSLLEPNWRAWCMQFDIPANCQIFGQLVANAGIEGILYPSKFTNKNCLAIYPQNFDISSFVVIEGDAPEGVNSRLDVNNKLYIV